MKLMKSLEIIVGIFIDDKKILLLKRTKKRKSYPGRWNVISAKIEEGESPGECLSREIREEIKIKRYNIIKEGKSYLDIQKEGKWRVYPYLCKIVEGKIKLDKKEHDEYKWVLVSELTNYDIVPGVISDLKALGIL